ncbi:DMT family transporter [Mesorhizobium sp. IMUNJ 23232]|uniref:DMT family transporter n=1 Tax=Mesorhizobium sp. IMUNJ 23232 TaxID=3376064 RepID=UPI0037920AC6
MGFHIAAIGHGKGRAAIETSLPFAYTTAVFGWLLSAGVYIAAKWIIPEMPPWALCFWRLALACVILLPIVRQHYPSMIALLRDRPLELLVVGVLGLTVCQGLIYVGLEFTNATTAGIIMALAPMITMVLAHFLLAEKMGFRQAAGAAISMFGMIVIVARGDLPGLLRLEVNAGELLIVGSAVAWALYTVLLRRLKFGIERLPLLVLLLGMGAVGAAPLYLWEIFSGQRTAMDTTGLLALAYVAGPGGAFMYYLYNRSVDTLGASRAGMMLYLQTAFVAILAYIFLGERLQGFDIVGGAFIVAGLLTAMLPARHKPTPAAS